LVVIEDSPSNNSEVENCLESDSLSSSYFLDVTKTNDSPSNPSRSPPNASFVTKVLFASSLV
jgi:hypothetical protein